MNVYDIDTTKITNTYMYLYKIAEINFEELNKNDEGSFYKMITIVIFSCFTIEAYMNHIGKNVYSHWKEIDRIKTLDKLKILFTQLELDFDKSREPIQSIYEMFEIRNKLAHGNTESINKKTKQKAIQINEIKIEETQTSWEEKIIKQNVKKYFENMERVIFLMNEKVNPNENPFLMISTTSTSVRIQS
jgi:hypothetical protein